MEEKELSKIIEEAERLKEEVKTSGSSSTATDLDLYLSPHLRRTVIEEREKGKSDNEIASSLSLPPSLANRLLSVSSADLQLHAKVLLSYIQDSIDILADTLKTYWQSSSLNTATRKLCIDVATTILETAGLLNSSPSYQVVNITQNNYSNDIKVLSATFSKKMEDLERMIEKMQE